MPNCQCIPQGSRCPRATDPPQPFWPSSPCNGPGVYGNPFDQHRGNLHYWGVYVDSSCAVAHCSLVHFVSVLTRHVAGTRDSTLTPTSVYARASSASLASSRCRLRRHWRWHLTSRSPPWRPSRASTMPACAFCNAPPAARTSKSSDMCASTTRSRVTWTTGEMEC